MLTITTELAKHVTQEIRSRITCLIILLILIGMGIINAFGQVNSLGLGIELQIQPSKMNLNDALQFDVRVMNSSPHALLVASRFQFAEANQYGEFVLEYRLAGSTEFRPTGRIYIDTFGAPGQVHLADLLRSGKFMIIRPDHYIGLKSTTSFASRFAAPPGHYEVRVRYVCKSTPELRREAEELKVLIPDGEFKSNAVSIDVHE
jgi:hypothetical protein